MQRPTCTLHQTVAPIVVNDKKKKQKLYAYYVAVSNNAKILLNIKQQPCVVGICSDGIPVASFFKVEQGRGPTLQPVQPLSKDGHILDQVPETNSGSVKQKLLALGKTCMMFSPPLLDPSYASVICHS